MSIRRDALEEGATAMKLGGRKILVTGAGGFIGSHLCEELVKAGASVRALVRYNSSNSHGLLEQVPKDVYRDIEIVSGDIRDSSLMLKRVAGCGRVIHLAALIAIPYSYEAPESYVHTNVLGTLNVLQACLGNDVERLVHVSTSEVYGTALYTPIDENHPLQAQSPYSAGKIAADKMAESFHLSFGLPVVTMRPFNCFGPRQSARAFIPAMISQILSDETVVCGSLEPYRDYTFVKDTAAGLIAGATVPGIEGLTINVGSGKKITMGGVLDLIMNRMNVRRRICRDDRRKRPETSEVYELMADNTKAKELLGWFPRYSLEQGLDETIAYVRANLAAYKTSGYVT